MTSFARQVLSGLPDTNVPGNTNNFSTLQAFLADSNKAGGKIDVQASPTVSMFGRYGFRDLTTDDQPNIPLPSGGAGNGHIYARNRQFVLGAHLGVEPDVAARGAFRLLVDRGREGSAGARH